jgi:transcriptional regulator with XRE-family HTH domain
MYDQNLFKQRLIELKKDAELTYGEIAEFADIRKSTLVSYIYYDKMPSISAIYSIADAFRVSIDYSVGRSAVRGKK